MTSPDYETVKLPPLPPDEVAANRDRWASALESSDYRQATGELRNSTGFCCLGVAEDARGAQWKWNDDSDDAFWLVGRRIELVDPVTGAPLQRPNRELPTRLMVGSLDPRNHAVLTGDGAYWLGLIETDPSVVVWDEDDGWSVNTLTELNDSHEFDFRLIAAIVRDQPPAWDGSHTWASREANRRNDDGVRAPAYSRWSR